MAAPTIAITVEDVIVHRRSKNVLLAFQMYGGTDVTGATGETVDLTTATNPKGKPRGKLAAKPLPANTDIEQITTPVGFVAELKQAAVSPTLANYQLVVYSAMGTPQASSYNSTLCPTLLADSPKIIFRIRQKLSS
jgi:hypothetical protein